MGSKCATIVTTMMTLSSSLVRPDPAAPKIQLVGFRDLVTLAREGSGYKRPDVTRTRQDKSFAALELHTLQGEVSQVVPTQANIFEHFTPRYEQLMRGRIQENKNKYKVSRQEKIRQSKQRSSYVANRGTNYISSAGKNRRLSDQNRRVNNQDRRVSDQDRRVSNQQPERIVSNQDRRLGNTQTDRKMIIKQPVLSFAQQSEFWAEQSKKPDRSNDYKNREFKVGDVANLTTTNREQTDDTAFNYYDVFEQGDDQQTVRNFDDDDIQPSRNKATGRKGLSNPRNGVRKAFRKQIPNRVKSNKARQPVNRKTLTIPIFLPTSVQDLSFVNSLFNPNRARKPAQTRSKPKTILKEIVEAKEQCVDKVEDVEETVYEEVEECSHSYDQKCQTSYITEYESQQEEECNDTFNKKCEISYLPKARNETVEVCMNPLVKDCNLSGPEVCKTKYITECFTLNNAKIVVDDIPSCKTVYNEKCETSQTGYTTEEECKSWPKQVCSVSQQIKKKFDPQTKCEKAPQEICGPPGCVFVAGPRECYDKVMTIVTDVPLETCYLDPSRKCEQVTKLVPILTPVEECVDVPKEICQKVKGKPQKIVKQVTKKWCYTPTEGSGLV